MVGIVRIGAYLPKLRLSRKAITRANAWLAPGLVSKGRGVRTMAFWDEDAVTMAVESARDLLAGGGIDRETINALYLASTTMPFADRQNASIVHAALQLNRSCSAMDVTGNYCAGLLTLKQAFERKGSSLVVASDHPVARSAGLNELRYSDGAAAVLVGDDEPIAEYLGGYSITTDFVDHFRISGESYNYNWEERWIREEGYLKLVPQVVGEALAQANLKPSEIDCFILPSVIPGVTKAVARQCGIAEEAVCDALNETCGDTGAAHALLMLAHALEQAKPGQKILVAQFGQGCTAVILQVTDAISSIKVDSVSRYLQQGEEEENYLKLLTFNGLLPWEKGMRGEKNSKTALTVAYRYKDSLLGFVGGKCKETGVVQFPPSKISVNPNGLYVDTQEPYPLAELKGKITSFTADDLAFSMHSPSCYGLVDFEGGGRLLMDFAGHNASDLKVGDAVRFVFRIKDVDEQRGFHRYFWKAAHLQ